MRLPPTGENGRLAGRHREQALLLQKQKPDQKIAACGSSYMRLPPTGENARLAGRHREQALLLRRAKAERTPLLLLTTQHDERKLG
jgi:hypothetical protein